jgi:hypothetical protein
MSADHERRQFIKTAGAGAAILFTTGLHGWARETPAGKPLHPGMLLPGVYGYADAESVAAGQTIRFYLSSSTPCRVTVCKLGKAIDDPAADEVLHRFDPLPAAQQPLYPGSYVFVAKGLSGSYGGLSAEGCVRPWRVDRPQALLAQAGFTVRLNAEGGLEVRLGNTTLSSPAGLLGKDTWHHWALAADGREVVLWLDGKPAGRTPRAGKITFRGGALTLGAAVNRNNQLEHFLDGDLAACALHDRPLTAAQVGARYAAKGLGPAAPDGLLAAWHFTEESGAAVRDASAHGRHGQLINHGTWMVGGPSFGAEIDRFGGYQPHTDAGRGHALRLAADDLYDCGWRETVAYTVPASAKPGFYVARVHPGAAEGTDFYDISFVVRKAAGQPKAPVLVLASTNTWRAYNATPFAVRPGTLKYSLSTEGGKNNPLEPPAYSFYRAHAAGQGTYQVGLRMPWPAAGPYVLYGSDYSHLLRGERYTHLWLEREGIDYDVITDTDLHKTPALLKEYPVFLINGHSEYWSVPMYEGLERYLGGGGQVVILSGNSLFWRVSYNDDCTVMECRKVDAPGEQVPAQRRGEAWHSHDGGKGGLLRETAYPGWKLTGLEMLGWINSGLDEQYGPYVVDRADHFLFNVPEPVGLKNGDAFGLSAGGKLPGANGHEIDIRLSTLKKLGEKPAPVPVPDEPAGITTLATGRIPWKIPGKETVYSGESFDFFMRKLDGTHQQGAEMIYWERPAGGKVFNAGAIRAGWALYTDPAFGTLVRNVLHHFGVKK